MDKNACLKAKLAHEEITRKMQIELKEKLSDFYVLSTGCTTCEVCACPDEPLPTSRTAAILYGKPRNCNFAVSQ